MSLRTLKSIDASKITFQIIWKKHLEEMWSFIKVYLVFIVCIYIDIKLRENSKNGIRWLEAKSQEGDFIWA